MKSSFTLSQFGLLALAAGSVLVQAREFKAYKGGGSVLAKRQTEETTGSQAFTPDVERKEGDSCAEAWGEGYIDCVRDESDWICYNPTIGQSCCSEPTPGGDSKSTHYCPGDSFCLVEGQCCPNGLSPETCANNLGISLPAGFTVQPTGLPSGFSLPPTGTAHGTGSISHPSSATGSPVVVIEPNPDYLNKTSKVTAAPSYTGPRASQTTLALFTGGAVANAQGVTGGLAGAVVALLGLIGGLL